MELLIDADSMAYRAAAAAEKRIWLVFSNEREFMGSFQYKKDAVEFAAMAELERPTFELKMEPEPVTFAIKNLKGIIRGVLERFETNVYDMVLSGKTNYRDALATIKPYKGNRVNLRRPHHLEACRQFLVENYNARIVEGYEADDAVAMGQTEDTCIVTIDKDLKTVEGWNYDWVKDEKVFITEEESWRFFYGQMLTGDSVDNIPGCPGIGPKKAFKALDGLDTKQMKCAVGLLYAIKYNDPESAFEENWRLLWMSRKYPNDGGDYMWI